MSKILITGAATGIGRDSALELARRGHEVILTGKNEEQINAVRPGIERSGLKMKFDVIDVRKEEDLQKMSKYKPDVLINNAAIGESGPISEEPMERVRGIIDTNLLPYVRASQIATKYMIPNKAGRIILIGSEGGKMTMPYMAAYNMTKYAIESLADGLRMELEPRGIFVSLIEPGKIDTGFNQKMAATKYDWMDEKSQFADMLETMKKSDEKFWDGGHTTKSTVRGIVKAVEARKPKARYVTPRNNALFMALTSILPSRFKDWILKKAVGY